MEATGAGEATGTNWQVYTYIHQVVATVKLDFPTVMKFHRKLTPLQRISRFCQGTHPHPKTCKAASLSEGSRLSRVIAALYSTSLFVAWRCDRASAVVSDTASS